MKTVIKGIAVSLLCLTIVAIGAPLFNTTLVDLLREHKGWVLTILVVLPLVYVISTAAIRKELNARPHRD